VYLGVCLGTDSRKNLIKTSSELYDRLDEIDLLASVAEILAPLTSLQTLRLELPP